MSQATYKTCLQSLNEAYQQAEDAYKQAMAQDTDSKNIDDLYDLKLEAELLYRKAQKKKLLENASDATSIKNNLDNATKELKKSLNEFKKISEIIELVGKAVALAAKLAPLII